MQRRAGLKQTRGTRQLVRPSRSDTTVQMNLRSHSLHFRSVHEAVLKDCLRDHSLTFRLSHQSHVLRLHVSRKFGCGSVVTSLAPKRCRVLREACWG